MKQKANNIEGMPGNKSIDQLVKATGKLGEKVGDKVWSKIVYQHVFCDKFSGAKDTVDVETIFEDMDTCPYPNSTAEFWTTPECSSTANINTKVPIIFNTAEDVISNEDYPKTVREYLLEVKKDTAMFTKIINAKSTDGLTFLDYLQFNISINRYSTQDSMDAAKRIIQYLCKYGGVYSKYKDTVKCP
jgi:hypothetical protein